MRRLASVRWDKLWTEPGPARACAVARREHGHGRDRQISADFNFDHPPSPRGSARSGRLRLPLRSACVSSNAVSSPELAAAKPARRHPGQGPAAGPAAWAALRRGPQRSSDHASASASVVGAPALPTRRATLRGLRARYRRPTAHPTPRLGYSTSLRSGPPRVAYVNPGVLTAYSMANLHWISRAKTLAAHHSREREREREREKAA